MSLTRSYGQFIADMSPNRVPAQAAAIARMGFIDCVGTMIAGRDDEGPQILRKVLNPGAGAASLWFSGVKATAPEAGWLNGTAAHALDYDDVALRGHPSTVLVPAILAEAETLDASGADMIAAYVAGYEVWADLVRRDKGFHHGKGWHPTGIFGAIGAAAACAALRRLDAEKAAMAIALGASQSSGLMANFGTMTKPFHAGRSAHSGMMAARLAEAGFTANLDALEHPQGFLNAVSPAGEVDRDSPSRAGVEWAILKHAVGIKKYPTCYCTHRAIDGMLGLMEQSPVKAEDVRRISVSMSEAHATILRNHRPETGLSAKFSMEFAMSSAIIARRVGLAELTDGFVRRADIQALMPKVEVHAHTDYDPDLPGGARFDQVTIELASGATLKGEEVRRARGHADRPLSENELFVKFEDCLSVGRSEIPAADLFARLRGLEGVSARALTAVN